MKRFLLILLFLLLAFYIGWPLYSAWQIHGAVRSGNAEVLKRKIDFVSVRRSLQPAVEAKIAERVEDMKTKSGAAGAVLGNLIKGDMLKQVSNVVLDHIVTAENIIKLARQSGTLSQKIEALVSEELGKIGGIGGIKLGGGGGGGGNAGRGLGGLSGAGALARKYGVKIPGFGGGNAPAERPAETPAPTQPAAKPDDEAASPAMGLANVKRFGMSDPLSFEIGVAKDPAAAEADLTAQISFKDFDWKLTGLVPRLK